MKKTIVTLSLAILFTSASFGQNVIPLNKDNWDIKAQAHVFENYMGKSAVYIQQGTLTAKNTTFLDGTIEFDVYLTERQSFPGVYFRAQKNGDLESFYLRPHLSGKPDATQAVASIGGISAWQMHFGPSYSFPYKFSYDRWTHVKLVVNGNRGQVFLDYSKTPHLSFILKLPPRAGEVAIGGGFAPMHYADVKIDKNAKDLVDFKVAKRKPIRGIIQQWEISDKFEEKLLADPTKLGPVISTRNWGKTIRVEENNAANISTVTRLRDNVKGNTVFARLRINSDKDQIKLLQFGYSDRVVAILNGKAIYRGTNRWRTRDYRYLGTVGLFDAIYLRLKKGENTLLMAVSEDFGGWGITGKIEDMNGLNLIQ